MAYRSETEDPGSPAEATAGPARRVFLSYASQDAAVANSVVEHLEQLGLRCWMAPRDVKPGAQYADAIVGAINEAKAVVLVLSGSAVASSHVGRIPVPCRGYWAKLEAGKWVSPVPLPEAPARFPGKVRIKGRTSSAGLIQTQLSLRQAAA